MIEKLKTLYTFDGNKVYVSTYDPFYSNLFGYAIKRNFKNVTELLEEWGFKRIYLADLPSDYQPYDWQKDLDSRKFEVESDYQVILDEMIIEDNKVYIDSQSSFYNKLYVLAVRKGKTINELLKEWGYERIYEKESQEETEAYSNKEQDRIGESLENVKQIQGTLSKSISTEQKIQRSRKLANEMKKLYGYRCQLCNYEKEGEYIPEIVKVDGTNYMEVHHIIPVSQYEEVEDDTNNMIDTYKNVIVVCAHHHRYLHYHDGGFEEISENKKGELFFQSRKGMKIRIFTNYHLSTKN
ncbi:HNH endonuclease [Priestia megaterium]|uniref:HNH endonuclease n=1 Tax=Priestia megaterium TaxID=1404 RepID=UPI001CD2CDDB|nr:HNH endonuclease signature motif containing protein [Priestia megaterium]